MFTVLLITLSDIRSAENSVRHILLDTEMPLFKDLSIKQGREDYFKTVVRYSLLLIQLIPKQCKYRAAHINQHISPSTVTELAMDDSVTSTTARADTNLI